MEKHSKYKHPSQLDLSGPTPHFVDQHKSATIAAFDKDSVDLCVQENGQQENNLATHQQNEHLENRRGRSKRKSNTMQFKKQTVDLLDSLTNSRNKLYFLFGVATFFAVEESRRRQRSEEIPGSQVEQSKTIQFIRNCSKQTKEQGGQCTRSKT